MIVDLVGKGGSYIGRACALIIGGRTDHDHFVVSNLGFLHCTIMPSVESNKDLTIICIVGSWFYQIFSISFMV